jgi:hypothetical protein
MTTELPEYSEKFQPRWPGDEGGYTADQMRAYGDACADAERRKWRETLSDALQSDFENGVKWLNEQAAAEFGKMYPALAAAIRA